MRTSRLPFASTLIRAVLYFFSALSIVLAIAWPGYTNYLDARRTAHITEHAAHLDLMGQQLGHESLQAGIIVKLLSGFPLSQHALIPGPNQQQARADLAGQFARFANSFSMFSQLRVLDQHGNEIVLVNNTGGNIVNVPPEGLQNKADRDYFQITSQLNGYELYVSSVDLNQERGVIERPHNATQRFATPILDGQGQFIGMIVANLDIQAIIDRIKNRTLKHDREPVEFSILNRHGYWLSANNPDLAWGWQLGRPENNLATINPEFWAAISDQTQAVIPAENGAYLSLSVFPMKLFDEAGILAVTDADPGQGAVLTKKNDAIEWKTLVFLPDTFWLQGSVFYQRWAQGLLTLFTLALAAASWLLARQHTWRTLMRDIEKEHTEAMVDLYENAPCCYQSVDGNGKLVRMNQTGLDWLGYKRHEAVGQLHYSDILQPDPNHLDDADPRTHLERIKQDGHLTNHPMMMRRKNGSLFPVSLSSKALCDENGNFLMTRTTIADMTDRYRLEEKLREQAFTDELTGAINRRQFNFLSERVLNQMQRTGKPCVLMALDIDHFKRVNDTYGHAMGDLALKAFVRVCKENVRTNDLVARMGGEEFVVLLPDAERDIGITIAGRIRAAVENLRVELPDGKSLSFTVSIGVTVITPDHSDLSHALSRADERLYRAKTGGRNRVVAQKE